MAETTRLDVWNDATFQEPPMSETTQVVPDGMTLLRAEDYSALQDIAGPVRAWAEAEKALGEYNATEPNAFNYPRGGWADAYNRWLDKRQPFALRERETRIAMFAAARATIAPSPSPETET